MSSFQWINDHEMWARSAGAKGANPNSGASMRAWFVLYDSQDPVVGVPALFPLTNPMVPQSVKSALGVDGPEWVDTDDLPATQAQLDAAKAKVSGMTTEQKQVVVNKITHGTSLPPEYITERKAVNPWAVVGVLAGLGAISYLLVR